MHVVSDHQRAKGKQIEPASEETQKQQRAGSAQAKIEQSRHHQPQKEPN